MPFREKSAWIELVTILAVYGYYFFRLIAAMASGDADSAHFMNPMVETVVVLTILQIVVFAIVVTERLVGERISQTSGRLVGGAGAAVALLVLVVGLIRRAPAVTLPPPRQEDLTRLLGDVNAVQRGRIGQRVARRAAGKLTGRLLGRIFK